MLKEETEEKTNEEPFLGIDPNSAWTLDQTNYPKLRQKDLPGEISNLNGL